MHTVELMCYCWTVSALLPACSELRPFPKFYHCHRRSAITSIFSQSYCRNNRETESLPRNPSAFLIVPKAMTSFAWHVSFLILCRTTLLRLLLLRPSTAKKTSMCPFFVRSWRCCLAYPHSYASTSFNFTFSSSITTSRARLSTTEREASSSVV